MTRETHSDSLSLGLVQFLKSLGGVSELQSTPHMTAANTEEAKVLLLEVWNRLMKNHHESYLS